MQRYFRKQSIGFDLITRYRKPKKAKSQSPVQAFECGCV